MVGGAAPRLARPGDVAMDAISTVPEPASLDDAWQLTRQDADAVMLVHHHRGPTPGSWGYQASQSLRLVHNRLEWELSIRNLSRLPMPARLGWRLHFPEDFAHQVRLDGTTEAIDDPTRGHAEGRDAWDGIATLGGQDGRFVLLRAEPPLTTLHFQRHATRSWLHLDLMTPDVPVLMPLPCGEELTLRLTLDLTAAPRGPSLEHPGPPPT